MHAEKDEQLTQMKYSEWLASLLGACLIALALGAWLHDVIGAAIWVVLIAGVALHSLGDVRELPAQQLLARALPPPGAPGVLDRGRPG
jgi:membrane-bound metal-dependent hydrolase YbcI (DUF457 family)